MKRLALIAVTLACSSDSIVGEQARLADLSFEVPVGWHRVDRDRPGLKSSEWQPEDNAAKESILILRSETAALPPTGREQAIAKLLDEVPKGFAQSRPTKATALTTNSGLSGAMVELDFRPPGSTAVYHRVHAVLVEKSGAVVHILYTARNPDSEQRGLKLVINTIREEA
jgi:hypothetical protein